VTGVILAGGRGQRMGEVDKGWVELDGRPLVERVLERFAPQVGQVLISANRNRERYAALGHEVIGDLIPDFAGPLAGLHAAFAHARYDLVATVPCDSPWLPMDLVERLRSALERSDAQAAVARSGGRLHPVFLLCRKSVAAQLEAYLASGERKAEAWCATLQCAQADFDDQLCAFRNINTPADLGH
jgi:molybdopterin-guanine dinucleotide biosynthesis protein A